MVKQVVWLLLAAGPACAQAPADYERRIADLERKIQALEAKLETLAAAKPAGTPATAAVPAEPQRALTAISSSGDYASSADTETRLPVSGYMDFHFNKDRGEPFRPDFHRFVLLFGHSFANRIKFWSEFEVEHALVEGGE